LKAQKKIQILKIVLNMKRREVTVIQCRQSHK
jgi:hypothetical protein